MPSENGQGSSGGHGRSPSCHPDAGGGGAAFQVPRGSPCSWRQGSWSPWVPGIQDPTDDPSRGAAGAHVGGPSGRRAAIEPACSFYSEGQENHPQPGSTAARGTSRSASPALQDTGHACRTPFCGAPPEPPRLCHWCVYGLLTVCSEASGRSGGSTGSVQGNRLAIFAVTQFDIKLFNFLWIIQPARYQT